MPSFSLTLVLKDDRPELLPLLPESFVLRPAARLPAHHIPLSSVIKHIFLDKILIPGFK
jgi:hypothetical protein